MARRKSRKVTSIDAAQPVTVRRDLHLVHAIAYVVGTVIGSGIFISPKGILSNVESVGLAFVMWAFCGLVSCLGALLFIEFSLGIPKAGGEYVYIKSSVGDMFAFISLWTDILASRPSSMAVQSMTAAAYLLQPIYGPTCTAVPPQVQKLVAASSLLFLAAVNSHRVRFGAWFQVLTTVIKVSGLVVIIVTGWIYLARGSTESFQDAFAGSNTDAGSIGLAFYSGMWAYSGYGGIVTGVTEVKNPNRNIPISIIGGVIFVIIVYLMTNVAYLAVVTPKELLAVDAVAITFSEKAFGPWWSWFIPVVVCCSVIGSLNSGFFSTSRLVTAGANEVQIPKVFSMIHTTRYTPLPSILASTAIGVIMLSLLGVFQLINWLSFLGWLDQALMAGGLLWLRYKSRTTGWPFTFPWICHLIYFIICITFCILPFFKDPWNCVKGLLLAAASLPVYFLFVRDNSPYQKQFHSSSVIKWLTDSTQKYLLVVLPHNESAWKEENMKT